MTDERDFDRLARAWLERGPDQAPDRAIAAVLQAVETTPQVRSRPSRLPPWRFRTMVRTLSMATVAVTILAVAGAGVWISRPSDPDINPVGAATPSPAATATPTASPPAPTAGPTPLTASPAASATAGNATAVAAGYGFTCAITGSGGVKCWGDNTYGQLGNGTTSDSSTPVDVAGLESPVSAISVGGWHSCALMEQGGVQCWGRNDGGQLGDGTVFDKNVPVEVLGLASDVTAIGTGTGWSCAITTGGGVTCWGWDPNRLYTDASYQGTPVDVAGLDDGTTAIAGGGRHTCAVTEAGGAKCWGHNPWGQLGDDSITSSATPVDVAGPTGRVTAITAGDYHTCALLEGGGVTCWGDNRNGQLGVSAKGFSRVPVGVSGLATGVTAISAGRSWRDKTVPQGLHTCALMAVGGVKCWGLNASGQLGNGSATDSSVPVDVSGLSSGITAISAGAGHSCALTDAGGVLCWGSNANGQLGDGTTTDSRIPVVVSGL